MRYMLFVIALSLLAALWDGPGLRKTDRASETGEPGQLAPQVCGQCPMIGGPQSVGIFLINLTNSPGPDGSWGNVTLPAACNAQSISDVFFSDAASSVNGFYREMSGGRAWIVGEVIGTITIPDPDPQSMQCFAGPKLVQAADQEARTRGLALEKFGRRVYITAPRLGCRTAASGGPTASGAQVPVSIFGGGCPAASHAVHEIGHTFGLGHAMLDTTYGGGPWGAASQELGDVMGFSGFLTPFNAVHRDQLGWISPERKHFIDGRQLQPGSTTSFYLAPLGFKDSGNEDPRVAIVSLPNGSPHDFYLSVRAAEGLDAGLDRPAPSPGIAGGPYLRNLSIHWFNRYCPNVYGDEFNTVRQRSYLLKTLADGASFTPSIEGANRAITFRQLGFDNGRGSLHIQISSAP